MVNKPIRIIMVEGALTDREMYQRYLGNNADYQLEFINEKLGENSLKAILKTLPVCIFLDCTQSGKDSIEFVNSVKQLAVENSIPVVPIFNGHGTTDITVDLLSQGDSEFLIKGDITPESLKAAITNALEQRDDNSITIQSKKKILIIEDNPLDRELYQRLLRETTSYRFEFFEAETGSDAFDIIEYTYPDCILLDYNLPDLSGLEFIDELRQKIESNHGRMPVIVMLTGQGSEHIAVDAMKKGAQDYLSKSELTPESLLRSLTNALEKHDLELRLSEKEREFEQFTYAVSHDLQAPLRKIRQFCDMLTSELGEDATEEVLQINTYINNNAQRLHELVAGLLDYYSIDVMESTYRMVSLEEVIDNALLNLDDQIQTSQAVINVNNLPTVAGHPALLLQLFQNLIQNSIKYQLDGITPVVSISAMNENQSLSNDAEDWQISVTDNGIGIDSKNVKTIFQPFRRLHSSDQFEGSGLGLSICKKVARNHHGRIWVESEPGKGTTFYVTLAKLAA